SDEAVASGYVNLENYKIVDWILGEEKETSWPRSEMDSLKGKQFKTFTPVLQDRITQYLNSGGNIFISGAYLGTDLIAGKNDSDMDVRFAKDILKFWWVTDHAVKNGQVVSVDKQFFGDSLSFQFNTGYDPDIYTVESPDALGAQEGGRIILRYMENNFSAAVCYDNRYKTVMFGFPFETIKSPSGRDRVMKSILNFLSK
ncbi:MAG: hypothetical protein P8X42_13735, partial [Calditrichaceae bacterium]